MKFIWFILHGFTGCKDEDMIMFKNHNGECKKCGRITFYFKY